MSEGGKAGQESNLEIGLRIDEFLIPEALVSSYWPLKQHATALQALW